MKRSIDLIDIDSSNLPRLQSCSQKWGHTRPVIAGSGLNLSIILAASSQSPSLILASYEGMSMPAGQFKEQGGLAILTAPNIEWYLFSPTVA
jgi:hypothetical protein